MNIFGVYSSTIFRDEGTGFTIFRLKVAEPLSEFPTLLEIKCKGTVPSAMICVPVKMEGEFSDDETAMFVFTDIVPYTDSYEIAKEYLCSDSFKGLNEKTAEKILEITGNDIFSFATKPEAHELLCTIKGVTDAKAKEWLDTINRTMHQKMIFDYISKYGCSFKQANALFKKYGAEAIDALKRNPYKTGFVAGMQFSICDVIAKENGFSPLAKERIDSVIMTVLNMCYEHGDMYITFERLLRGVDYLTKKMSAFPTVQMPILYVAARTSISPLIKIDYVGDDVRCYLKQAYADETGIAASIKRLNRNGSFEALDMNEYIRNTEKRLSIKYSERQKKCFDFLKSPGVKIITGGPGTGKSTVINGLIDVYKQTNPDGKIALMAPTGRAAQRITEITGMEAGTIHRMLSIKPFADVNISDFNCNFPYDFIVVDEASMIDSALMNILLSAIKLNTLVIFVGDIDQLPSVGAGNVLKEMISSNRIEKNQLNTNYRQTGASLIIDNANAVNYGRPILTTGPTFEIIECDNEDELKHRAVKEFVDRYHTNEPYKVQMLSSTKAGEAGTRSLNKEIQEIINTSSSVAANFGIKYKIGDKVMTVRNNYEDGYYNGDVGTITFGDKDKLEIKLERDTVTVARENINDVELAYACTVHKSQGSEYETTIIVLPRLPSVMLRRNLLYTAITRAKKQVIILTEKDCIEKAVNFVGDSTRTSALSEKIIKEMELV